MLSIIPVIVTFSCFLLHQLHHLPVHSLSIVWTGGLGGGNVRHAPLQTIQLMCVLNTWFLTMCVPSSGVLFGMLLLTELSQFQIFSVLLNGKLCTDYRWDVEDGTDDNT